MLISAIVFFALKLPIVIYFTIPFGSFFFLISFNNSDYSIDYSNTISSILVVNSDLSISLNINDPLMPFDCTNFNLSGMINCNYDSFTLENNQNCSFNFGGSIQQNNTMFVAYNLDMYDSNGNYNGSIEIVIQ